MTWKQLLSLRITPWVLLSAGLVAFFTWFVMNAFAGHDEPLARRWKREIANTSTDQFKSLLASPPDAYASLGVNRTDWGKTQVAVYTVPATQPPRPRPTLRDLADIGQAHAIDFLANGSPAMPRSWTDLQKALVDPGEASAGDRDPFVFDRTLVATVVKGVDWEPGDRMVWSRVLVQPINFLFAGYTVAATENETVKVTSIEATRTRKLTAELGLTLADAGGPKASIGPSDEHVIKSVGEIKVPFEKLGVDITPSFLRIIRESETGSDVRGNTLVSLSVVTDPARILKRVPAEKGSRKSQSADVVLLVVDMNLDDKHGGSNTEPPSITVLPQAPLPHCPLMARVWMLYQKRDIASGRENYDEGQQIVRLIQDADPPRDIEIVGADDVSPAAWSIKILPNEPRGSQNHDEGNAFPDFVEARVGHGPWRPLVFTDYTKASKLAHWFRLNSEAMITKDTEATLGSLSFRYPAGASFVPFKNTNPDNCTPGPHQTNRGSYELNGADLGG